MTSIIEFKEHAKCISIIKLKELAKIMYMYMIIIIMGNRSLTGDNYQAAKDNVV